MKDQYAFLTTQGGPAFPSETHEHYCPGMSLRDYLAGQVVTGMLANPVWKMSGSATKGDALKVVAESAYAIADAMLAARKDGAK